MVPSAVLARPLGTGFIVSECMARNDITHVQAVHFLLRVRGLLCILATWSLHLLWT